MILCLWHVYFINWNSLTLSHIINLWTTWISHKALRRRISWQPYINHIQRMFITIMENSIKKKQQTCNTHTAPRVLWNYISFEAIKPDTRPLINIPNYKMNHTSIVNIKRAKSKMYNRRFSHVRHNSIWSARSRSWPNLLINVSTYKWPFLPDRRRFIATWRAPTLSVRFGNVRK